jgi:hypothetical protein
MDSIRILIGLGLLCYGGYHLYMFIYRPEEYAANKKRQHEEKIAKLAVKQAERNHVVGGVAGALAKAFLGAVFNRRHH